MLDTYKQVVVNQYEAVLAGLNFCIDRCPDALWNESGSGASPFVRLFSTRCSMAMYTLGTA